MTTATGGSGTEILKRRSKSRIPKTELERLAFCQRCTAPFVREFIPRYKKLSSICNPCMLIEIFQKHGAIPTEPSRPATLTQQMLNDIADDLMSSNPEDSP